MSLLLKEIKRVCEEERVSFQQFVEKIKRKDRPKPVTKGDLFGGREQ